MRLLLSENKQALRMKSAEHWTKAQALYPRPHPLAGVAGRPQRAAPWQVPWAQMAAVTLPFPFTGPGIDPGAAEGQCPPPTSPGPQRGFGDHPSTHSSQSTPEANRIPSLHPPPRPRPAVHVTCHLSAGAAVQNDSGQGRRCSVPYDDPQPETTSASTGGSPTCSDTTLSGLPGTGQVCSAFRGVLKATSVRGGRFLSA